MECTLPYVAGLFCASHSVLQSSYISLILDIWIMWKPLPPSRRSRSRRGSTPSGCSSKKEPKGVPAGELARLMAVPQNTMSAHLAILARAGLVIGERQSRSIIYRADLLRVREVGLFLLKDCCGGRPDICAPLVADLTPRRSRKVRVHD